MIKNKAQRVAIFVDVQNMYHSAKNIYKANVNFAEILKVGLAGRQLIRALAYVINSESREEKNFFEILNKQGFETKIKDLQIFYGGAKKADWDVG
ncbi:MAG: NYN domain-containing protein, partial [Candidatus Aenigmarchaeota archaeon]|nr:NYN domain-containing protein [Candidatus Aenigmarchaeota archaeon]